MNATLYCTHIHKLYTYNAICNNKKMDLIEPLFDAVVQGEEHLVMLYLNLGATLTQKNDEGKTALHMTAASQFGEQLIPFLIAKGADIHAMDNMGYTPLHLHALRGRIFGISCLLHYGAVVNAQSPINGFTPLHLALLHNHIDVANVLLGFGADHKLLDVQNQNFKQPNNESHRVSEQESIVSQKEKINEGG
jgi:ankyrin repeat protein